MVKRVNTYANCVKWCYFMVMNTSSISTNLFSKTVKHIFIPVIGCMHYEHIHFVIIYTNKFIDPAES